jgi:3-hydroxyisobutyrate dehydrogenase-like beta-hydroxyacid dehydrogenase
MAPRQQLHSDGKQKPAIGWIGIGKMGAPMSRRVLRAGYRLTVLDPLPENRASVVAEGADVATDLADLCARADIVVATIPNDAVLRAVTLGADGLAAIMRPPQIFIEMSTVSPQASSEVAVALAAAGVDYLRAPVSGSTATAQDGRLTVLASGAPAAYERASPLFSAFSAKQYYVGAGDEARYLKLVLNTLVGATSAILAEALALGRRGGLSRETMLTVLCDSVVASPLIAYKRDMLLSGDFEPAFSVNQMIKDFDLIGETARADHVPMFTTSLIRQLYEQARAGGLAERDFFVLVEQQEALAGLATG